MCSKCSSSCESRVLLFSRAKAFVSTLTQMGPPYGVVGVSGAPRTEIEDAKTARRVRSRLDAAPWPGRWSSFCFSLALSFSHVSLWLAPSCVCVAGVWRGRDPHPGGGLRPSHAPRDLPDALRAVAHGMAPRQLDLASVDAAAAAATAAVAVRLLVAWEMGELDGERRCDRLI